MNQLSDIYKELFWIQYWNYLRTQFYFGFTTTLFWFNPKPFADGNELNVALLRLEIMDQHKRNSLLVGKGYWFFFVKFGRNKKIYGINDILLSKLGYEVLKTVTRRGNVITRHCYALCLLMWKLKISSKFNSAHHAIIRIGSIPSCLILYRIVFYSRSQIEICEEDSVSFWHNKFILRTA